MKNLLRWAGAIALALTPAAALAQAPVGKPIQAPSGYLPAEAIYCDDGTGHAALCSFGSGGGGGGGTSAVFSRVSYVATAAGAGYAIGDQVVHMVTTNAATGAAMKAYWVNVTQELVLQTPPALSNLSQLPVTVTNTAFGANCLVVTGNQSYAIGSQQQCTMTPTGRIKVGLSSAGNIDPAAQLATTLEADIIACKYRASPVTWSDLWTGAIRCNSSGALVVDASGFGMNLTQIGGASYGLGPNVAANSAPVTLATDGVVGAKTDAACTTSDATACSGIALWKEMVAQYAQILQAYKAAGTTATMGLGVQGMTGGVPLVVSGQVADGSAPGVYSLPAAGADAGGLKRTLRTDTSGQLLVGGGAIGINAPASVSSTGASGTTAATANTFTTLVTANAARKGCSIQNTSTGFVYVFVGSGTATIAGSYALQPVTSVAAGGTFSCTSGVTVIGDTLQIASSISSATFAGSVQ